MDKLFEDVAQSISKIVAIDSSQAPAKDGMPFGEGAAKALDVFLQLAQSFGFETKNYDNYAGEVIFGEGEDFAILAHLDVVPAGSGWAHDPFGGEIDYVNKRIWGRGTMDDKGPAIITLYCMKQLKDSGFAPKKRLRLIVGCNEETGWECIKHFNECSTMPECGFSPDADFPVIYAEKGILQVKLTLPAVGAFTALKGGERANMVCDYCEVTVAEDKEKIAKLNAKHGARLSFEGGKLVCRGQSAHGSMPQAGVNAIAPVLEYLGLTDATRLLFEDGFGLCGLEDVTGKLTFSPDIVSSDNGNIYVTCDIRYPATYKKQEIIDKIAAKGVAFEELHYQAPLYNDAQGELVTLLCNTYNEVTGKHMRPIAIGGGTYARALKCGAAFGPEEAGEESTIHQPNEYITFEKIEKCLKIYKLAIERIAK